MSSILEVPPAPSVAAAVEGLKAALGNLTSSVAAGRLEGLSESELLAVVVDLQGMGSQLQAVTVAAVAEVRDGEVAKTEGFTSTMRFLETKAGLSTGQSRAQVALGEKLAWEFEATQQAWLAGEISEGMVQVITTVIPRKLKRLPEAEYYAERLRLEAMALHHARTKTVAEVRRAIDRAAIAADPAGALEAAVVAKRGTSSCPSPPPLTGSRSAGSSRGTPLGWCCRASTRPTTRSTATGSSRRTTPTRRTSSG